MKKFFAAVVALMILTATAVVLAKPPLFDTPYIGNSYRLTLHVRDCDSVWIMNHVNQVGFNTRAEAFAQGYHPCGNCRPDLRSDLP